MSFLVRYPVGNTIIRDCQYWPTITRDDFRPILVADLGLTTTDDQNGFMDRGWPCPVTQEVLMHMAWRVREWRVTATTFTYTGRQSASPTPTWTISGTLPQLLVHAQRKKSPPDENNPLRDVTSEQDLLGPATDFNLSFTSNPDRWKTLRNAGVIKTAAPADVTLTSVEIVPPNLYGKSYVSRLLGGYVIYDPITQLFYPPISIGGNFQVLHHDPPAVENSGYQVDIYCLPVTRTTPPPGPPPFGISGDVQQGTLTIINPVIGGSPIVIPIGMLGRPAGRNPPFGPSGGAGSANFVMTPILWWPYQNSAGDPVYDTATGEIENDPFG